MKILIIGFIVFVIWSVFSVWLYVEKLEPTTVSEIAAERNDTIQANIQSALTDSVIQPEISPPNELIIYFDFDETQFNSDSQINKSITEIKNWLNKNPESVLLITGYTDSIGTSDYNQKLGLERAHAVRNYCQTIGVDPGKTEVYSKGENQPINTQASIEGMAKYRRAVITLKN